MKRYTLLLREQPGAWAGLSPDEMQAFLQRYRAWSASLAAKNAILGGEKLVDGQGRVLQMKDGHTVVTDGPYTEAKEVVGGFFLLQAEDMDAAQGLLEGSPHWEIGSFELREIDEM